jgi:hypothetical protein
MCRHKGPARRRAQVKMSFKSKFDQFGALQKETAPPGQAAPF